MAIFSVAMIASGCANGLDSKTVRDLDAEEVRLVREQVSNCGLSESQYSVEYVPDFQSAEARIHGISSDSRTFSCLGDIEPFPVFTFQNPDIDDAFGKFLASKSAVLPVQGDGSWDRMTGDEKRQFAIEVTRACGLPVDRLKLTGEELHVLPSPNDHYEQVDCLLGKLKKAGVSKMGFVGNEAVTPTDKDR